MMPDSHSPESHPPDSIPEIALAWHRAGRAAAIATVIETWGSAPRRVGAQMVVDAEMAMAGSVSGGCVEGAVVSEAIAALGDGRARLLEYGVADGDAFALGLACGGRIRILLEPIGTALPVPLLEALVAARAARQPIAYVKPLPDGAPHLAPPGAWPALMRADRSSLSPDGAAFVAVHNPPLRLVIIGAVHIAQALVPMAQSLGHAPILVDPRAAFATRARFPDGALICDWPDAALEGLGLDARSAVVALSHDPKIDDPALAAALASPAYYIGALGSRRSHAARLARLAAAGHDGARIHGPVGLDIGAAGPAEIALSIMAQITQDLRSRPG